jgi:hypothetical protein
MMALRTILLAAALATVASVGVAAAAPAPTTSEANDDDDEDCDDIMDVLKELDEQVRKDQAAPKSRLMSCADSGQLLGIAKASRAVAQECYDKGKRRDELVASFEKIQQQLEGRIGSACK